MEDKPLKKEPARTSCACAVHGACAIERKIKTKIIQKAQFTVSFISVK